MALKDILGSNPSISADYKLRGNPLPSHSAFKTRDEKRQEAELNIYNAFEAEYAEPLPASTSGILVLQQGQYPMNFDVAVNPNLCHHCARPVIDIGKVLHQPYVFASHTYLLRQGRKRLDPLIDGETVLSQSQCEQAVKKYLNFKGNVKASFLGTRLCIVGRKEQPYRVWQISGEIDGYLFFSLLNGAVFEVAPHELPEMREVPDVFNIGDVRFTTLDNGDYTRG